VVVDIVVSRLQEPREADADSAYLCRELGRMKRSSGRADILFDVVESNLSRARKAVRAITKLRGYDENDRVAPSE